MKYDVFAMGNALVDMEFSVTTDFLNENNIGKGLMTLIEKDRQSELLVKLQNYGGGLIKKQCGGSAANTAIALSQFGGKSYYSCKVAKDDTGEFYLNDLKANGVDTKLTVDSAEEGTTGKCFVMVTPDADRTMNTHLGITARYSDHELDMNSLKDSKYLYVEGYLVASPTGQDAALKALKFARSNNVKTALTLSDPFMVKTFMDNFKALTADGVDVIFCNEEEAIEFTQTTDFKEAREELKKYAKSFVITLGKNGATLWDGTMFIDIEPHVVDAIDSNGAGDMFAGAYLYGITNGHTPASSATLASLACSKVVSQFGPRLENKQVNDIKNKLFN